MLKRTRGEKIFAVFNTILLLLLSVIFILPIWHVLMGSISDPLKISSFSGLILYPLGTATLGGYRLVFNNSSIIQAYGYTLLYVTAATSIGLILNILAAYVMSRRNLYWGRAFSLFVLFTMLFNGGLVPGFMIVRNLGLLNTVWAVILSGALSAYNIIIMRTSFSEIPEEMLEAARIDGAGHFRILLQIVLLQPCHHHGHCAVLWGHALELMVQCVHLPAPRPLQISAAACAAGNRPAVLGKQHCGGCRRPGCHDLPSPDQIRNHHGFHHSDDGALSFRPALLCQRRHDRFCQRLILTLYQCQKQEIYLNEMQYAQTLPR